MAFSVVLLGLSPVQRTSVAIFFLSAVLLSTVLVLRRFGRSSSSFSSPSTSTSGAPKPLPSPPKIPIIGNLHQLGSPPHRSLRTLSREYGPLMLLQLGRVPTLVVSSAEMAEEVLKAHDLAFASRPHSKAAAAIVPGGRPMAFAPYGEHWRKARKIAVVHLLSSHRVQEFRPAREAEVARLVGKISELSSRRLGSVVDMSRMLSSFTCSVLCRAALGVSGMEEGTRREMRELVARTAPVITGFLQVESCFPSLASLGKFTGMDARLAELARRWRSILDRVVEEAAGREERSRAEERGLVDVLLGLGRDADTSTGSAHSRDGMKAILQAMITAGTDASYATIEGALKKLVENPTAMKKAQEEVRGAVQRRPMVTEDDVSQMSYLKAIIKETLRLQSSLLLPRESTKAVQIQGYEIPAKTRVIINTWAIATNPDYWTSPEQFHPERFLQSGIDFRGGDFQFIPFGAGRRICPGIHFANAIVELTLANLLYHFDWSAENLDLGDHQDCGPTTRKKRSLFLVVKPYLPRGE